MDNNNKPKQVLRILEYLRRYGSITSADAMVDLGIWRLASRINELKKMGIKIDSKFIEVTNRYGEKTKIKRYFLIAENEVA